MMLTLEAHGYTVRVDTAHGATMTSATWITPDGREVRLLEPLTDFSAGLKAGSFVMAPFANRIDRGHFVFAGRDFHLPINTPQGMAIHGFSRDRAWQIVENTPRHAILVDDFAEGNYPFRYRLTQEIRLSEEGIRCSLSIRNEGDCAMPFGLGLHPWFPRTPLATLAFEAAGVRERDGRGLPVGAPKRYASFSPDAPVPLGGHVWFDGCFSGWKPMKARIRWPEYGAALNLIAEGALRHLHVYIPDDRPVFCAEPVSHFPDAINRPELGAECAMDVLQPGETLSGSMLFCAGVPGITPGF